MRSKTLWITVFLLFFILALGLRLRIFSYSEVPNPGETADEYSFGWLGISLIKDHYPIAWSGIGGYKNHDYQKINVDGIYDKDPNRPAFSIDKPWFDHPPLFGLITGGWAYLSGVRDFKDTSVSILRQPMIVISAITIILVFFLAYRIFGLGIGLVSAFLYSTVPTMVISSRLALAENGYIPLFLGSIILADYYIETKKIRYWVLACIFGSIAILFKLSAVAVFLTLALIAFSYAKSKKWYLVRLVLMALVGSLVVFAIWGLIFDWHTFVDVILSNTQRFYGAAGEVLFQAVNQFRITTKSFTDGWLFISWISFFILVWEYISTNSRKNIIPIAIFSYMTVFVIFGSETYGWYKFPFFPFLVICLSWLLVQIFKRENPILLFGIAMIPFGTSVHRLLGVTDFQPYVPILRIFTLSFFGLLAASYLFSKRKYAILYKVVFVLIFVFLSYLSVKEVFFYGFSNWITAN